MIAWKIAQRELRGGLRGFYVFLACLALGVAAIAAVGSVRVSIQQGLAREGAAILGGDAAMAFTYRFADATEKTWMQDNAVEVSEIVDFRSMMVVDRVSGVERGLTQVKGVDAAYPLIGEVVLAPQIPLAEALSGRDGVPGLVAQQVLMDRMGLAIGDIVKLGVQPFVVTAVLLREPDSATGGFSLGPRSIVRTRDLAASELLGPGTLFDSEYRLRLPQGVDLAGVKMQAENLFRDHGLRWRDSRNGAPGIARFVDRIGAFLVLVGLAGLAVGGIGVSAAVRAYLDAKTGVIATLKTLGAQGQTIFAAYLIQIGILSTIGIALGLVLGACTPLVLAPLIEARLPIPAAFGLHPAPLVEAALYGALTALIFTLWPLARTEQVRAAALFRDAAGPVRAWPRPIYIAAIATAFLGLVGLATWFSGIWRLTLGTAGGILGALALLSLAAWLVRIIARKLSRSHLVRGRTALRLALGAVGGPGGETSSVVLSLGLGLAVLASVGQIDANLRSAIDRDLPKVAPSYFFVDIQNNQLAGFLERIEGDPAVSRVDHAPMLRGVITQINGRPAREVAGAHWVLQGDRGVTYSATPSEATTITEGAWWPADYVGSPQISFAAEEAAEMGLVLGDSVTVNILGRDITGRITSFREVDFSTAGIGFVLSMNPSALAGAPHTHIATVYADPDAEAAILRDVAGNAPNITAIRVRDAIERVSEALSGLAAATSYGAAATLITGFVVLIGAAAAGERARVFEAAVLKTIGATRAQVLLSFALRSAFLGAAAGSVAVFAGGLAGYGVMTFVMDSTYTFEWQSAIAIVAGGALATLFAGLGFAWRPLAMRPAQVLRGRE